MIRLLAITTAACLCLGGCASTPDENYGRYLDAQAYQVEAAKEQPPLVDLKFDDSGRLIGLAVNQPYQPVNIQPHRPTYHPIWGVIRTAIPVAGSVWGLYAAGDAFADVLNAGGGSSSQSSTVSISGDGSGNTAGRDIPVTFDSSTAETVSNDIRTDLQQTDIRNDTDTTTTHTTNTDTRYDYDRTETTSTSYDNDTTTTTTTTTDTVDDHSSYTETNP